MIGERLKKLRKEQKINQEELASVIGVQKSAISLYETDKNDPSDKVKVKIAKYFHVSLDYLLGVIDDPVPFYDEDIFLRLPDNMLSEEKTLLLEFLQYLDFRRKTSDVK